MVQVARGDLDRAVPEPGLDGRQRHPPQDPLAGGLLRAERASCPRMPRTARDSRPVAQQRLTVKMPRKTGNRRRQIAPTSRSRSTATSFRTQGERRPRWMRTADRAPADMGRARKKPCARSHPALTTLLVLFERFDACRDDGHVEGVGYRSDCRHHGDRGGVGGHGGHEGSVSFDDVERAATQGVERAEAGPEVVSPETNAQRLQFLQRADGSSVVLDEDGLGHFQDEPGSAHAGLGENPAHRGGKARSHELADRDVHRQVDRPGRATRGPLEPVAATAPRDPIAQLIAGAAALGGRSGDGCGNMPQGRVSPEQQRFDSRELATSAAHHRLVSQVQVSRRRGRGQVLFESIRVLGRSRGSDDVGARRIPSRQTSMMAFDH